MERWLYSSHFKRFSQRHLLQVSINPSVSLEKFPYKRTVGAKRRKDALRSKLDIALEMLKKANSLGINASFVLFDSWFSFPSFINNVYQTGYNVICRLKSMPNICYLYEGKEYDLSTLYRKFAINTLTTIINPIPGKSSSLAFIRYLFLSVTKRLESDPRTLGELFQTIQVEMKELSAPQIFIELLSDKIKNMSNALNIGESIYILFMKIVDSIKYYFATLMQFDALEGCET